MEIKINATNWFQLKKQLRPLVGKAIFKLERTNSLNDGTFFRVLHKVKPHELVFWSNEDGEAYLEIPKEKETDLEFFENGFKIGNLTYTLERIMNND